MQTSTRVRESSSDGAVTFGAVVAKKHGMFRGLFIGIDRYASDAISWLSCAVRDASALGWIRGEERYARA
jgi:hypothetical protein